MNASPLMSKYIPSVLAGFIVAFLASAGLSWLAKVSGNSPGITPPLVGVIFGSLTAFVMANLVGTKKGKAATAEQKQAVLDFRPEPGKAMLIVFREGFVGMAAGMDLRIDDQFVAQLKSPRFTAISVEPGGHQISMAFGGLAAKQNKPTLEGFIAAPGEIIAFRATMAMGALKNRILLERVDSRDTLTLRLTPMTMIAPSV